MFVYGGGGLENDTLMKSDLLLEKRIEFALKRSQTLQMSLDIFFQKHYAMFGPILFCLMDGNHCCFITS